MKTPHAPPQNLLVPAPQSRFSYCSYLYRCVFGRSGCQPGHGADAEPE